MTDLDFGQKQTAAESFYAAGNADAAMNELRSVLAVDPENYDALDLMVRCHLRKDDEKQAAEAIDHLIAIAPEEDNGYRYKAALLAHSSKKKDHKEAVELAQKAVSMNPYEPSNHLILAQAQLSVEDFAAAEQTYQQALEDFPDVPNLKTSYGSFLMARGRTEEAGHYLSEASDATPGDIDVIILRGNIALREGRLEEARDNALWALQEDATDPDAIHLLAQVKMRSNPILGLWWRYAAWMGRFSRSQSTMIVIGMYVAFQVVYRGFVKSLPYPVPIIVALCWLSFCVLTWVAPSILKRMVRNELKSVQVRDF